MYEIVRLHVTKWDADALGDIGYASAFEHIRSATVVASPMQTPDWFLDVVEIVWKDGPTERLWRSVPFIKDHQLLGTDGPTQLYLMSGDHIPFFADFQRQLIKEFRCFLEFPRTFSPDSVDLAFVGRSRDLKRFLVFLGELGIEFRLALRRPYRVKTRGLLSGLTDVQYRCLHRAYHAGHYDIPKRADVRRIARDLEISRATVSQHIRKAERGLLQALFA